MQFLTLLFITALTSAAAVPEPAYLPARPGSLAKRAQDATATISVEGASNIVVRVSVVTNTTDAGAAAVQATDYEPSSSCKPSSICFDGFTCGLRYGGCYDANFCAGSTSFPMPTCTDDPSAGLTQNFRRRMDEVAEKDKH